MKQRAADGVAGVDRDERHLRPSAFAAEVSEVTAQCRLMSCMTSHRCVHVFDIVLFMSSHHLHPSRPAGDLVHDRMVICRAC
jgi:hypothetical protein